MARLATHHPTGWTRDGGSKSLTWQQMHHSPNCIHASISDEKKILDEIDHPKDIWQYTRYYFLQILVIVPNLSFSIEICCNICFCVIAYEPPVSQFLLPRLKSCQAILSKPLTTGQDCTCCLATLAYWRTFWTHSAPAKPKYS